MPCVGGLAIETTRIARPLDLGSYHTASQYANHGLRHLRLEQVGSNALPARLNVSQAPTPKEPTPERSRDTAQASTITRRDVERSSMSAIAALDESFFRVRFDRLTPLEKRYLRAMAELGPGPHRSGDIAEELERKVTALAPTRNQLIRKGMIWSPSHGDTAFTVPLFDEFMHRIMPVDDWKE